VCDSSETPQQVFGDGFGGGIICDFPKTTTMEYCHKWYAIFSIHLLKGVVQNIVTVQINTKWWPPPPKRFTKPHILRLVGGDSWMGMAGMAGSILPEKNLSERAAGPGIELEEAEGEEGGEDPGPGFPCEHLSGKNGIPPRAPFPSQGGCGVGHSERPPGQAAMYARTTSWSIQYHSQVAGRGVAGENWGAP